MGRSCRIWPGGDGMWGLFESRFEAESLLTPVVRAQARIDRLLSASAEASEESLRAELGALSVSDLRAFYYRTVQLTGGPAGQVAGDVLAERWLPCRDQLLALRKASSTELDKAGPKPGQLTEQDLQSTRECAPIDLRCGDAVRAAFAGRATEQDAALLADAVRDYQAVADRVQTSEAGGQLLQFSIGRALDALARASETSRNDARAAVYFDAAAARFGAAGQLEMAASTFVRRDAARQRQLPDADTRLEQLMAGLDTAVPRSVDRAAILTGLAEVAKGNNDDFEAKRWLGSAITELADVGYPVPGSSGTDEAVTGWIGAIPAGRADDPAHFLRSISALLTLHSSLGALRMALVPEAASDAEAEVNRLAMITLEIPAHLQAVQDRLEHHIPRAWPPSPDAGADGTSAPGPVSSPEPGPDLGLDNSLGEFMEIMALVNQLLDLTEHTPGPDKDTIAGWQYMAGDCISRARPLGQPVTLAQALEAGGRVKIAASDPDAAVKLFEEEYQVALSASGKLATDQAILAMTSVAKVQLGRGKIGEASEAAGKAIGLIERDRYRVSAPFQQAALLAPHADVFAIGVFSAWKMATDGTAPDPSGYDTMLQRMELSKARASVRRLFLTPSAGAASLDQDLRQVNDEIHALDPAIQPGTPDPERESLIRTARAAQLPLRQRRLALWDRRAIATRDPDAAMPHITLTGIQQVLDPDEVVIYFYWLRSDTLLIVTINADAIAVERKHFEPEQTALLSKLIGELGAMKGSNLDLDAMYIEPLGPLLTPVDGEPLLAGKQRLIISPHGMLHWFPFAATPYRGAPLVRSFAIRTVPNLSSLLVPRAAPGPPRVAALAVSTFPGRPDLGELRGVRAEAADVTAISSAADIAAALMPEPSRAEVLGALHDGKLAGVWCLLIATHGHSLMDEVSRDAPLESVLELADDSLDGYEIAASDLGCEVVVLTACYAGQRALGGRGRAEQPGDELFGLGAAFIEARCGSVLAPAWPADDDAMSWMITMFHRNLAQRVPADVALAQAQRAFLDQADDITRSAYYWAPLMLPAIGRPMPIPPS